MSKGSNRRPGEIPAGNWEAIFGKKPEPEKVKSEFEGIDIDRVHHRKEEKQ